MGKRTFSITLLATITLDLTQAVLIGAFLSGAVFFNLSVSIDIEVQEVDVEKLRQCGIRTTGRYRHVRVAHLTGPRSSPPPETSTKRLPA